MLIKQCIHHYYQLCEQVQFHSKGHTWHVQGCGIPFMLTGRSDGGIIPTLPPSKVPESNVSTDLNDDGTRIGGLKSEIPIGN